MSYYYGSGSSEWTLSEEYGRYYRYVPDGTGQSIFQWADQNKSSGASHTAGSHVSTDADKGVPEQMRRRTDSGVTRHPEMTPSAPDNIANTLEVRGTPGRGWVEALDSRYRVRKRAEEHQFFKQGRVFAMLWAETASETMQSRTATENSRVTTQIYSDPAITQGRFGQDIYSQIRRFVIVKVNRKQHFVLACAITTYGDRGVMKPGCNAEEHAIVHLKGQQPYYIRGEYEKGMTKMPIAVEPSHQTEEMKPASRIRFGKVVSIECNVKVRDIGMVVPEHRSKLLEYFQDEQESGFEPDEYDDETPRPSPAPVYATQYNYAAPATATHGSYQSSNTAGYRTHPASGPVSYGAYSTPAPYSYQAQSNYPSYPAYDQSPYQYPPK